MAVAVGILCSCASMVLMGAVAWMNYRFMAGLGALDSNGMVLGIASLAVDSLFASAGPLIVWGRTQGRRGYVLGATVLLGACGLLSFVSALGFAAEARDRAQNRHEVDRLGIEAAHTKLQVLEAKRKALAVPQASRILEARLVAMQADPRWLASQNCTRTGSGRVREWCAGARRMAQERAVAREAERLDAEIEVASSEWIGLRRQTGRSLIDAQLTIVSEVTGWPEGKVRIGLTMLAVFVLIGGAGFGLALGLMPLEAYLQERKRLRKPSAGEHLSWMEGNASAPRAESKSSTSGSGSLTAGESRKPSSERRKAAQRGRGIAAEPEMEGSAPAR